MPEPFRCPVFARVLRHVARLCGPLALVLVLSPSAARAQDVPATTDSAFALPPGITAIVASPLPKIGGYIQAREIAQEHVGLTAVLNRARLSVDGALPWRFAYR